MNPFKKLYWPVLFHAFLLIACKSPSEDAVEYQTQRPFKNVVFVIGDDHSYTAVGAYGNDLIRTPNLDRLAGQGSYFTRAYANAPICSATRQSMLTGKYPHATGVNLLFTPFPDDGNVTVAEILKEEGFSTALIGKDHFNHWVFGPLYEDGPPDHGFDLMIGSGDHKQYLRENPPRPVPENIMTREKASPSEGATWGKNADMLPVGLYEEESQATFLANKAADFIEENRDERFCLWLAFHQPHAPFYFPIEYAGKYDPAEVPLPQGSPEDDRWVPEMFRGLTETERRGIISSYYSSVEYMDASLGIVLDRLDQLGLTDSTLIIYAGDQGYLLNDHKRFEKHTFWEESIKAPLIVGGGNGQLVEGQEAGALVEFIDMVPTALDLLGVSPHPDMQGLSFAPVLRGDSTEHKEYVFSEFLNDNKAMVASKEWKYIFTSGKRDLDLGYATGFGPSGIYHRLYNLKDDPNETTNLALKPEHQARIQDMQGIMLNFFRSTHPDAADCPAELNKIGQLTWYCEPRDVGGEYTDVPYRIFVNEAFE